MWFTHLAFTNMQLTVICNFQKKEQHILVTTSCVEIEREGSQLDFVMPFYGCFAN